MLNHKNMNIQKPFPCEKYVTNTTIKSLPPRVPPSLLGNCLFICLFVCQQGGFCCLRSPPTPPSCIASSPPLPLISYPPSPPLGSSPPLPLHSCS